MQPLLSVSGFTEWTMIILWAIVFVVTLVIELQTMNLTTIWFCISALVALICGITFAKPELQLLIFVILSFVLLIITRPIARKMTRKEFTRTNADRVIGMIGLVTKEIVPFEIGEVKVENNLWRAINNEGLTFAVGEKVSIDGIVGIKVLVSKISEISNIEIIEK